MEKLNRNNRESLRSNKVLNFSVLYHISYHTTKKFNVFQYFIYDWEILLFHSNTQKNDSMSVACKSIWMEFLCYVEHQAFLNQQWSTMTLLLCIHSFGHVVDAAGGMFLRNIPWHDVSWETFSIVALNSTPLYSTMPCHWEM